jgi:PAS domain S-box-containing protein
MNTDSTPHFDLAEETPGSQASDVHQALEKLREQAEKRRHLVTQVADQHSPDDLQRLVQELQVHQIELEMQYEELLRAQYEAQVARSQYVDLYDFAPVGYFTLTPNGLIEQLNLCASQQLGSLRRQLLGRRLAAVLDADHTLSCELTLVRADETPFFARLEGLRVAPDESGPASQVRLVVVDITPQRQAANALVESEARFRTLFEQSRDGMLLLEDCRFVDLNEAALHMLGQRNKNQVIGQSLLSYWPERQPDGRLSHDLLAAGMERAATHGWCRLEWMRHGTNGEAMWCEMSFNPVVVNGKTLLHAAWRDITIQRAAREQLRTSEERLQMALAAASSGVWTHDFATDQVQMDARTRAIFGWEPAAPLQTFAELQRYIHPDDRAEVEAALSHAMSTHIPFDLEHRILWPDGSVHHIATLGKVVCNAQGQPTQLTGLVRDITRRCQAQVQLRHEKEFSESLLENSIDGIMAFDRNGCVTAWNAKATEHTTLEANKVLGRSIFELYPRFNTAEMHASVQQVLAGEEVALYGLDFRHRQGQYDLYLVPLRSPEHPEVSGVLGIIRDVTERDRLAEESTQQRLRQQQEVLSTILSTQESERKRIAEALHNGLGQLLYATKLHLENQGNEPGGPAEAVKLLNEAIRATRTISFELTPGILEDFGLRTALEEMVKRISPNHLPVRLHLRGLSQRLSPQVEIAVYRIVQELLNNVLKHAQAKEARIHVVREKHHLEVTVEDNGQGFETESLITQPLAGIGLAGVGNRVALLGGTLSLNSQPGRGTIVSIELSV